MCVVSVVVEDKYAGPRLDDEIDEEFMKELMQWQKDLKNLHKKYAFKVRKYVLRSYISFRLRLVTAAGHVVLLAVKLVPFTRKRSHLTTPLGTPTFKVVKGS